jgi:small conductance mechanosensitive channel
VNAYEKKGGPAEEIEEYRQYITAVSGIKVDVSDVDAVWTTLTGWLMSEEGGLRWARNIVLFIVTVLVFVVIANMVSKALKRVLASTRQASRLLSDFMVITVRRLILAIGFIVGLAAMEVNIGPLLAVIGAAGFVIAFALQNSLGNFASGILILVFRPFDVGDMIEVSGILGKVKSMNLLSIQILTPDNKLVVIANNQVWGDAITNVTGTSTRRVDLVFGIAYEDDIEQAQRIMEDVVSSHERVLKRPETVIRVHELGDSSVNFVCRPWVKTEDYWDVYWDLTEQVKQRFDKEGISIPFPQRDVHMITASAEATA